MCQSIVWRSRVSLLMGSHSILMLELILLLAQRSAVYEVLPYVMMCMKVYVWYLAYVIPYIQSKWMFLLVFRSVSLVTEAIVLLMGLQILYFISVWFSSRSELSQIFTNLICSFPLYVNLSLSGPHQPGAGWACWD